MKRRLFITTLCLALMKLGVPLPASEPAIAAGQTHSLFLKTDETVWAAGSNQYGQLGGGTSAEGEWPSPKQVSGISNVKGIGAGNNTSFFITEGGQPWGTGWNYFGQLGRGNTTDVNWPREIGDITGYSVIDGGISHTLFLKEDGIARGAGDNNLGQLGDGTFTDRLTPRISMRNVTAISAGSSHSLFISDGAAFETPFIGDPVEVMTGVKAVSAGGGSTSPFSLFLKIDGTVWGKGANHHGQLGDGATGTRPEAVQIPSLTDVIAIEAGTSHSLFLKEDGTVWATGRNLVGQLGNGTTEPSTVPVQVIGLSDVVAISANSNHNLFLKADGTVWAVGYNFNGQLGIGNSENQLVPVYVISLGTSTPHWGKFPIVESNSGQWVDSGDWLGWLEVSNSPWVWRENPGEYIYVQPSSATIGKGWNYKP